MATDAELAARVASEAGQLLLTLREEFGPVDADDSAKRKELKDLADRSSHEFISDQLLRERPDDAVLSEEGLDRNERDTAQRVWIVDPLDGTSEYGQGRADFAVHIALWDRADSSASKLVAGVVDLPAQSLAYTAADSARITREISPDEPVRIAVSRSRPPELVKTGLDNLRARLVTAGIGNGEVEVLSVGSVGAKVAEILGGRADAYLHDTGFYEWDVAAPYAVAANYGLAVSHLDAAPVTFNHRPPWVTNLIVSLPALAPHLLAG